MMYIVNVHHICYVYVMYENICYVCHLKLLFTSTVESYSFFSPPITALHLSHCSSLSFNSWLYTCCHSWNRRTSSKQHRRVATGASLQKTTCCGGRNAGKKVSLTVCNRCRQTDTMRSPSGSSLKRLLCLKLWLFLFGKLHFY